jgi:CheY-like chemotaxis protein
MAHAISNGDLEWAVGAARELATRAVEHEQQMAALVQSLESAPLDVAIEHSQALLLEMSAVDTPSSREGDSKVSVLDIVRRQCVTARKQRLLAESLLKQLLRGRNSSSRPERHRVLVVEDSDDNRALAVDALEGAGLEVATAANGLEGLVAAHRLQPSVVVTDITMPILDGIQTARLLKASSSTRAMLLIAYTAKPHALEGSESELFAAIVPKPSYPDRLVSSVMQIIESRRLDINS